MRAERGREGWGFATSPMGWGEKRAPFALANGRRGAAGDGREREREWLKLTIDESTSVGWRRLLGGSQSFIIFVDRSRREPVRAVLLF
mgnify:CR=1 FL=1